MKRKARKAKRSIGRRSCLYRPCMYKVGELKRSLAKAREDYLLGKGISQEEMRERLYRKIREAEEGKFYPMEEGIKRFKEWKSQRN